MLRYDDDATATLLATWGEIPAPVPLGTRFPLEGDNVTSRVFRTARPARIDHHAAATGTIADTSKARASGREPACRSSSTDGSGA